MALKSSQQNPARPNEHPQSNTCIPHSPLLKLDRRLPPRTQTFVNFHEARAKYRKVKQPRKEPQRTQNSSLRTITECLLKVNEHKRHQETKILSVKVKAHSKLMAVQRKRSYCSTAIVAEISTATKQGSTIQPQKCVKIVSDVSHRSVDPL